MKKKNENLIILINNFFLNNFLKCLIEKKLTIFSNLNLKEFDGFFYRIIPKCFIFSKNILISFNEIVLNLINLNEKIKLKKLSEIFISIIKLIPSNNLNNLKQNENWKLIIKNLNLEDEKL